MSWHDIPSYVNHDECEYLCSFCTPGTLAIDVGVGYGRSAIAMAQHGAEVIGISLWDDPAEGTQEDFIANMEREGVTVRAIHSESATWAREMRGKLFADVIFIDAGHDYENVKADAAAYRELLREGGVMLFHDVGGNHPGVDRAVSEIGMPVLGQVYNIAAFQRTEPQPLRTWGYWEGAMPGWVKECVKTLERHAPNWTLINRSEFEDLRREDKDLDIDRLTVFQRSDFVRGYLLSHYGGLYIDPDCIAVRSLQGILDKLEHDEFVGYLELQGDGTKNVGPGLMASRPHGAIATAAYRKMRAMIHSRVPLEWMTLALSFDEAAQGQSWCELSSQDVMPIRWYEPQKFFAVGSERAHKRAFNLRAYTYMCAGQSFKDYVGRQTRTRRVRGLISCAGVWGNLSEGEERELEAGIARSLEMGGLAKILENGKDPNLMAEKTFFRYLLDKAAA